MDFGIFNTVSETGGIGAREGGTKCVCVGVDGWIGSGDSVGGSI